MLQLLDEIAYWNNKTVLVTGAAGSIGGGIVRQLIGSNAKKVMCLDRAETPLVELDQSLKADGSSRHQVVLADILDSTKLRGLLNESRPDVIIHCAALKHVPFLEQFPEEALRYNFQATATLADLAEEVGVDKFVLISTDKAVAPVSVMGFTKRLAEMELRERHLNRANTKYLVIRFGNVLGSNGSFSKRLESELRQGAEVSITHPEASRYLMSITQACKLAVAAVVRGGGGELFVYDMGQPVKVLDMLDEICAVKGIPRASLKVRFTGLRPGEKITESLFYDFEIPLRRKEEEVFVIDSQPFLSAELSGVAKFFTEKVAEKIPFDLQEYVHGRIQSYASHLADASKPLP